MTEEQAGRMGVKLEEVEEALEVLRVRTKEVAVGEELEVHGCCYCCCVRRRFVRLALL